MQGREGDGQDEAGNPPGHWFKIMSHRCEVSSWAMPSSTAPKPLSSSSSSSCAVAREMIVPSRSSLIKEMIIAAAEQKDWTRELKMGVEDEMGIERGNVQSRRCC